MVPQIATSYSVYIRPLRVEDAAVSCHWRNNPRIWRLTGSRPDRYITPQLEEAWISDVINRKNEKRFAICLTVSDQYIGNVFLTNIKGHDAFFHIFLGDTAFWGRNRALEASILLVTYAFEHLGIQNVYAEINKENKASIALAKLIGSEYLTEYFDTARNIYLTKWLVTKKLLYNKHEKPYLTQSGNCIYSSK